MEVVLTPFGLFLAHDEGDLLWPNRMDNVHVAADLDPVGSLRTAAQCMNALYRLQVFRVRQPPSWSIRPRPYI